MIRALTAHTAEIDDVEAAVAEIVDQLDLKDRLLKNSVGLLSCYAEFIDAGIVKALCSALPFEVVGTTTLATAARGSSEAILLSLMILTSDDVSFSTGLSAPILSEDGAILREAYEDAAARLAGKPALILSYAPLLLNVGGDFFVRALDEASGGVPNFGCIAIDHTENYAESRVLRNGEPYTDRYAFVLLSGDISPRFFMATISSETIFKDKGVVTSSQGNQLRSVSGLPVLEYLQKIGLSKGPDGSIFGINTIPFVVDYGDGSTPVVCVIFAFTPEGYAVCGGSIPEGAILSIGAINADEVVATTGKSYHEALTLEKISCMLIFSCVGRYFALGYDPMGEAEVTHSLLDGTDIPYQFTYSGGELCPVSARNARGSTVNRNHNDTCVICVL
jgi:hypothetical protein